MCSIKHAFVALANGEVLIPKNPSLFSPALSIHPSLSLPPSLSFFLSISLSLFLSLLPNKYSPERAIEGNSIVVFGI